MAAAAGVAVTGMMGVPAQAQPDHRHNDGLARFEHQTIHWHDCHTSADADGAALNAVGARCAELAVPLDYRDPAGTTITIEISRRAATDPAHRLGTLVADTGGDTSALQMPEVLTNGIPGLLTPSPALAAAYDLVGFDPRFVDQSTPLNCGWPNGIGTRTKGTGTPTRPEFDAIVAAYRDLAARCAPLAGELAFASTRDTARDLDIMRAALGAPKISYLGYSVGVEIGATYLQMFGDRVDRVVFDSGVNPNTWGGDFFHDNGPAERAALAHWAGWAAQRDATYHLGTTTDAVLGTVAATNAAALRHPLAVGAFQVPPGLLPELIRRTNDDGDEGNAFVATEVAEFRDAADGKTVTPDPGVAAVLRRLGDPTVTADEVTSTNFANKCADRAVSRDPETYWADIQDHRLSDPFYGPLYRGISPCAFWPTAPIEPPTTVDNDHPVLMAGATGDPNVPYTGQRALHAELHGSRFITAADTFHHGVFLAAGNPCVDKNVEYYLLGGPLPSTDFTCQHP